MRRPSLIAVLATVLLMTGCATLRSPVAPIHSDDPVDIAHLRDRLHGHLNGLVADGYSGVALVMRGNEVVLLQGYGTADRARDLPATDRTLFQLASVTKPFTAVAVLRLEMEGRLQVSDRITRFFDDVPPDKRAITIHQLLTHTSGMPHRVGVCWPPSAKLDRDEYVRQTLAAPLEATPGRAFLYSNDGYGLLGAIIEHASGSTYEQYLRDRLFTPAGMTRTGYTFDARTLSDAARGYDGDNEYLGNLNPAFRNDSGPAWCNRASGGLLSTVQDMRRWVDALRGDRILSDEARRAMLRRYVRESARSFAGYGWSLRTTPRRTRLAEHDGSLSGYFTADLHWYFDEDIALFVASNSVQHQAQQISQALARIMLEAQ